MTRKSDPKSVRRIGKEARKSSLPPAQSPFPLEDEAVPAEPAPTAAQPPKEEFDLDRLDLPDTDSAALESLAQLRGEVRAPVIAPEEERFPPTQPQIRQRRERPQAAASATAPLQKSRPRGLYDLVSLVSLLGAILASVWLVVVWRDPQSALNPLPPPTPFVQITATPFGQSGVGALPTPNAAGQIIIVATETPATDGSAAAVPILVAGTAFGVDGEVLYIANGNGLGCNWSSIGGTVTDVQGSPLDGYRIQIRGADLNETAFSGAALTFGPGGYELPLGTVPQVAEYTLQLFTPQGAPLTEPLALTTRADCEGNVAIVNFVETPR